jgi:group I intron endonuclease
MPYVYKIVNKVNQKVYIGSTGNRGRRWSGHKELLKKRKHHSRHLQSAWNLYGENNFYYEVLEETSKQDLLDREQYWIDRYQSYSGNFGYNIMRHVLKGSPTHSKISEEQAIEIIRLVEAREIKKVIAKKFGVTPQTVSDISSSRSWCHLHRNKIRWNRWYKIPDEEISKIKYDANHGVMLKDIATKYVVNQSTISRIVGGLRRKEVRYAVV